MRIDDAKLPKPWSHFSMKLFNAFCCNPRAQDDLWSKGHEKHASADSRNVTDGVKKHEIRSLPLIPKVMLGLLKNPLNPNLEHRISPSSTSSNNSWGANSHKPSIAAYSSFGIDDMAAYTENTYERAIYDPKLDMAFGLETTHASMKMGLGAGRLSKNIEKSATYNKETYALPHRRATYLGVAKQKDNIVGAGALLRNGATNSAHDLRSNSLLDISSFDRIVRKNTLQNSQRQSVVESNPKEAFKLPSNRGDSVRYGNNISPINRGPRAILDSAWFKPVKAKAVSINNPAFALDFGDVSRRISTVVTEEQTVQLIPDIYDDFTEMETALNQRLKTLLVDQGDFILKKHDIGTEMYFLSNGKY